MGSHQARTKRKQQEEARDEESGSSELVIRIESRPPSGDKQNRARKRSEKKPGPWSQHRQNKNCDVQNQQIGEQRHFVVLARREQQRRAEAADDRIQRKDLRVAPP